MKYTMMIITILTLLTAPWAGMASGETIRPGSDDYLRYTLGWSNERLAAEAVTEEREAFQTAVGESTITDPAGDVMTRLGTSPNTLVPAADILSASWKANQKTKAWEVTIKVAEKIPAKPANRLQFFIYADADGQTDNNKTEGIGAGMDALYSLKSDSKTGWFIDYRWFNAAANFWGMDRKTKATFQVNGDAATVRIPFQEVPFKQDLPWRVFSAIEQDGATLVDAAPTVGFPPAKNSVKDDGQEGQGTIKGSSPTVPIIMMAIAGLALGYALWTLRRADR